jgi:hypothetical protein
MQVGDTKQDPNMVYHNYQQNRSSEERDFCKNMFLNSLVQHYYQNKTFLLLEVLSCRKDACNTVFSRCTVTISNRHVVFDRLCRYADECFLNRRILK